MVAPIPENFGGQNQELFSQAAEPWTASPGFSGEGVESDRGERTIISVLVAADTCPDLLWLFSASLDQFQQSENQVPPRTHPAQISVQLLHRSRFAPKGITATCTYADFSEANPDSDEADIWFLVNGDNLKLSDHSTQADTPVLGLLSAAVGDTTTVQRQISRPLDTATVGSQWVAGSEEWMNRQLWLIKSNTVFASDVLLKRRNRGGKLTEGQTVRLLTDDQRALLADDSEAKLTPSLETILALMSEEYQKVRASQIGQADQGVAPSKE